MNILDLGLVLNTLQSVSDEDLIHGLGQLDLHIPREKLQLAFSAYGLTNFLSGISWKELRSNVAEIPDQELNKIRWRGVFVFRAYTAFLYMRSEQLESALNNVHDESPLKPFRDFFRSGSAKRGEDTLAQHIRNSLAHGTFKLSPDFQHATFIDYQWEAKIRARDFVDGLCHEVFRFYEAALHVSQ